MRRTVIILMSLFAMMMAGIDLKAQEITITLSPGWNWISYPNTEVMDVASALGDFVPMEGDIIRSKFASSIYVGGRWSGSLTQFMPGWGYKYYSARTEDIGFAFVRAFPSTVVTSATTDITATSAVVGGTVTVPEGGHVFLRGVCWDTESNPDIDGNHTTNGTGTGSFSDTISGLSLNTYYVRAYAVTDYGLAYGEEMSFTITDNGYVDLGLPSGTMWATCNVGATTPEEYGDYFAWGETQPKDYYDWSTYQYCNGSYNTLIKYCSNSNFGYNGFTDNLITLLAEDDAATANWGTDWRMPTMEEWQELCQNTTQTCTIQNGVNGRLFTGTNGNSLFLPDAGYSNDSSLYDTGSLGYYWSSSLYVSNPINAWTNYLYSSGYNIYFNNRYSGQTVRPVRSTVQNNAPIGTIDSKSIIYENGD